MRDRRHSILNACHEGTVMFTTKAPPVLVLGKPVRHRLLKKIAWTSASIAIGAGFIAGLYWLLLQQHYPFMPGSGSLKAWWDNGMGLIHSKGWPRYRHGIRDGGEPAAWTMVAATILGKVHVEPRRRPRWLLTIFPFLSPDKRQRLLPSWLLLIAPLFLIALIVTGTLAVTWAAQFASLHHVSDALSWQQITGGILLGRILHVIWNPIGSTIRYRVISASALSDSGVPLWVRYPLMPVTWQEAWQELRDSYGRSSDHIEKPHIADRIVTTVILIIALLVTVVGLLAKFVVAHGTHIPGMS